MRLLNNLKVHSILLVVVFIFNTLQFFLFLVSYFQLLLLNSLNFVFLNKVVQKYSEVTRLVTDFLTIALNTLSYFRLKINLFISTGIKAPLFFIHDQILCFRTYFDMIYLAVSVFAFEFLKLILFTVESIFPFVFTLVQ